MIRRKRTQRVEDRRAGVFRGVARRRANVAKGRRKTVIALVLGGLGLAAALTALPMTTERGLLIPLVVPLLWASIGVGALFAAGKAVVRLVTGRYCTGRTDFGLPRPDGRNPRKLDRTT